MRLILGKQGGSQKKDPKAVFDSNPNFNRDLQPETLSLSDTLSKNSLPKPMTGCRGTLPLATSEAPGQEMRSVAKEGSAEEPVVVLDESHFESEVAKLRGRWELASVLNFLSGIPPVNKTLNGSDAWVTALCKKLAIWWSWVAEGDIPLIAAKGEEICQYKELDSTKRLLILNALCEVRAVQDDTLSYINEALKQGNQISCFRKDRIGGDGNGTSYWYDGNKTIGHRLYREIYIFQSKRNSKGKSFSIPPAISSQWETLATTLEEFRKVAEELSSSKVVAEVDVGKKIENEAIPVLEKLQKNKERQLKRKLRQEMALNDCRNPQGAGVSRSCRTRRPVSYTFDEYDRAIDEAIQVTKKGKANTKQEREGGELSRRNDISPNGGKEMDTDPTDNSGTEGDSMTSASESDEPHKVGITEDEDDDYCVKKYDAIHDAGDLGNSEADRNHATSSSEGY
ncbi:hypothetical protein CJ030_MR7G008311 [Morella rubra]|uniref:WHIM1 domain-containing protein n=1 Tax=Morella rubra TaxID=262757 RepID=A0A6A1UY13_9ROSI|nr:hypothetical protein CJ030_MR7G008311 [Morella rubra]